MAVADSVRVADDVGAMVGDDNDVLGEGNSEGEGLGECMLRHFMRSAVQSPCASGNWHLMMLREPSVFAQRIGSASVAEPMYSSQPQGGGAEAEGEEKEAGLLEGE